MRKARTNVKPHRKAALPKPPRKQKESSPNELKGWQQIASFLGESPSVVQRWAASGMPVRRQGRFITTTPQELDTWLGEESGKPIHIARPGTDLTAELERGLAFIRRGKRNAKTVSGQSRG